MKGSRRGYPRSERADLEHVELPADYPYTRVLDEIKAAGYSGTELGPYGFLPSDAAALRRELERRSLKL